MQPTICPGGTYSKPAATSCIVTPTGTYTAAGATIPSTCPLGSWCYSGTSWPTVCAVCLATGKADPFNNVNDGYNYNLYFP